jgi:hypothetical protein
MKQRSRRVLIGLAVLVVVGIAAFVVSRGGEDGGLQTTSVIPTIPAEAGNPPTGTTATEVADGAVDEPGGVSTDPAAVSPALDTERPTQADLVVTYSGFDVATGGVLVGAYVAGLLEVGGACSLTLSDGTAERTATVQAAPDARTTSCGELALPEMTPGTWTGEVTYRSADGNTVSRDVEVEVP